MKLLKIVNAHMALGVLSAVQLPAATAYAVYKLKRGLEADVQFFKNEEIKIANKYGAKTKNGTLDIRGGRLMMMGETEAERKANLAAYTDERGKLCALEPCETAERRAIPVIKIPADVKLAPEIFEALEGFAVLEVEDAERA